MEIDFLEGALGKAGVLAVVNCSELVSKSGRHSRDGVLNGIAYDARKKLFFITGKNWPVIFKARIPYTF